MDHRLQRAPTLPESIATALRQEIEQGKLRPGDQLQSEQQLARYFDVSRPVVREAISQLKYDGLVSSHQGRGIFVADTAERQSFRIDPASLGDRRSLSDIFELRIALEAEAAALAAERRAQAHLDAMSLAIEEMIAANRERRDGAEADAAFHKTLAEATGNAYYRQFVTFLQGRIYSSIRAARNDLMKDAARAQTDVDEHRAIYEAVEKRDPEAARSALRLHLTNAAADLKLSALRRSKA